MRVVDVLDVSDLRFPGGTAHSLAEEIAAQGAAGYTTGLIHLNGPLVAKTRPVNPRLRNLIEHGAARLLVGREPIRAKVVVVRHPAVLQHAAADLPPITADHVVVVANAGPRDIDGHEHYAVAQVDAVARQRLGHQPVWAPIGPQVRDVIADDVEPARLLEQDWVNVIDVDAWHTPHPAWAASVPVIGRHSRDSPQKWPNDADVLRAVYPVDGSWQVHVLGGASPAVELVGELPPSWRVLPFGALAPRDFLAGIDFFVYHHDPRWIEAFGRTILEALAAGRPAILPPHFARLYGTAAVYAEPDEVRATVERLYRDPAAYAAQVRRGQEYARTFFGYGVHAARLDALIGPAASTTPAEPVTAPARDTTSVAPSEPVQAVEPAVLAPLASGAGRPAAQPDPPRVGGDTPSRAPDRVLLVTSNGTGMGHLTRLLAIARRLGPDVEPHFLSLSQAVPVVGQFGYPWEYLASTSASGLAARRWHDYFAQRVGATIERVDPAVVVFDGTWPYDGIVTVRKRYRDVRWIWSRRGMWYQGRNRDQLAKSAWFDEVVEPSDFASDVDAGVTARSDRLVVPPITLLDHTDLDDRTAACHALGLPPGQRYGLVSLGAGNINRTDDDAAVAIEALEALGVVPCVTVTAIASRVNVDEGRVRRVNDYPLSRRFRAFDVAVSAAGYNSFHELLRFGVPTLFVPNRATQLDDQASRAQFAADHGAAHTADSLDAVTTRRMLTELLDDSAAFTARAAALDPGNGAERAAKLVTAAVPEPVGARA